MQSENTENKSRMDRIITLYKAGQFTEAEKRARAILETDPENHLGWSVLSAILTGQRKIGEAIGCSRQALIIKPDDAASHQNLGNLLKTAGELFEAEKCFRAAIELNPDYVLAHRNLGNILRSQGKVHQAVESFRKAVELAPKSADLHTNLANVYRSIGKVNEAVEHCRMAILLNPNDASALSNLTVTTRLSLDDDVISHMNTLLENEQTPDADKAKIAYGLGNQYDRHRRYDEAFACWSKGAKFHRQSFEYNAEDTDKAFAQLKQSFSKLVIADAPAGGDPTTQPTFVLGLPRAGTSLVEQIMASHNSVFGAGELPDFRVEASKILKPESIHDIPLPEFEQRKEIGANYLSRLQARASSSVTQIIDKTTDNFRFVGLIHLCLPNAKIIHVRRDPVDTCLSIFGHYFKGQHPYAYDLEELAKYFLSYRDLMEHWENALPEGAIYNIDYERVVDDLEGETRKLLAHCNLEFDRECLKFHENNRAVQTASTLQVRKKIYTSAVGKSKRYEQYLKPLTDILNAG